MFLSRRFYIVAIAIILTIGLGYIYPPLFQIGQIVFYLFAGATFYEILRLYTLKKPITAHRDCADRFSNGDENPVEITLQNNYPFTTYLQVIDEIPVIFQRRDIRFELKAAPGRQKTIRYSLRPTRRGEYPFGKIRVFASTSLGLVMRRHTLGEEKVVKVYPSFLMLRKYELMAISNNLTELGIKQIRKIGHHTEFEQIKEYVKGDDYRTINWKASARTHKLQVNLYQDERSQHIYSVIDKGRTMQQASGGMTLLDYAINATLVISHVAIRKGDNAGLVTFEEKFGTLLPASKQSGQMENLLESLYNQTTSFGESDYSALYTHLSKKINKRSLLILYCNFDSMVGMQRQLSYLRLLSRQHLVLVIFFENQELKAYSRRAPQSTEEYFKTVTAEKFIHEKRLITATLRRYGIYSLLTTPDELTVDLINKYLELKSKRLI